ncbi:hypothetical protein C479_11295 [Halovivax asiaticus JCM 14624]|uniref:Uncharacterized protein n=1 Tax=Halovivax asiaticus JCM 14624 TaxID=1227490 RepID=M0BET2_9EURY|nr:hypothetical protein C479_11295 [Halovivax asiaticus JCM 14624]
MRALERKKIRPSTRATNAGAPIHFLIVISSAGHLFWGWIFYMIYLIICSESWVDKVLRVFLRISFYNGLDAASAKFARLGSYHPIVGHG